jgi:holliday junction DNA helicase RuvA
MIGSLRGTVLDRHRSGEVLVEVAGVGYRVQVPTRTLVDLRDDQTTFLHVHHHVREDAVALYGFATREERDAFEALLGASRVGPKLALAFLSVFTPSELRRVLLEGDVEALCAVPGVGKGTATRLLPELRGRLDVRDLELVTGERPGARTEVRAALAGLGYGPDEVRDVLGRLTGEGGVEDLLREALKLLAVERVAGA